MFNAIKVIRFITTFVFLAVLLASYAYLPLTMDINIDGFERVGKDFYFYSAVGLYLLLNLITYFFRFYADRVKLTLYRRLMVHILAPVLYFSLTLIIGFLTVVNNALDVIPSTYYYLNYLCVILILGWIFSFLFVTVRKL